MTDGSFMQSNSLNLLLKQQIIRQLEETDEEMKYNLKDPNKPYEKCISINKKTSRSIVKFYCESDQISHRCEEIKMELASVQGDESVSFEQHKMLCENYDLVENLLDHLLHYVECMILEIKSSDRLSILLNTYSVHENHINENVSSLLKKLCEKPDIETLEDIKAKLFISLNSCDNIKQLRIEFEKRKNDYHLAMKNFKIILEVMNVDEKSLNQLKKQLDEVLMNYQHCRCMINQEMPFILAERTNIIAECLDLLGMECDIWSEQRSQLSTLIRHLANNIKGKVDESREKTTPQKCSD